MPPACQARPICFMLRVRIRPTSVRLHKSRVLVFLNRCSQGSKRGKRGFYTALYHHASLPDPSVEYRGVRPGPSEKTTAVLYSVYQERCTGEDPRRQQYFKSCRYPQARHHTSHPPTKYRQRKPYKQQHWTEM